jgi:hypothetical protein
MPAKAEIDNQQELNRSGEEAAPAGETGLLDPKGLQQVLISSLPAVIPLVLSTLTVTLFALMRNGYVGFYGRYGISPEDIGMGQQHVIAGVVRFCLAGAFLRSDTTLKLVGLSLLLILVWFAVATFCMESKAFRKFVPVNWKRALVAAAIYLSLLAIVLVSFSIYFLPKDRKVAWDRIQNAQSVGPDDLSFLMVQATPASVRWIAKDDPPPTGFPMPDHPIMYLGHDDKMVVIYIPGTSSTWRVPQDKALLSIEVADGNSRRL